MNRLLGSMIPLLLLSAEAWGQSNEKPPPAAKEAEKAFLAYLDAGVARDVKALTKLLADDFTLTTSNGKLYDKAKTMGIYLNPDIELQKSQPSEVKARVYGDTVVLNMTSVEKGTKNGQAFENKMQTTAMLVLKSGTWIIVAEHVSAPR